MYDFDNASSCSEFTISSHSASSCDANILQESEPIGPVFSTSVPSISIVTWNEFFTRSVKASRAFSEKA